jgi:hypothetical protein
MDRAGFFNNNNNIYIYICIALDYALLNRNCKEVICSRLSNNSSIKRFLTSKSTRVIRNASFFKRKCD